MEGVDWEGNGQLQRNQMVVKIRTVPSAFVAVWWHFAFSTKQWWSRCTIQVQASQFPSWCMEDDLPEDRACLSHWLGRVILEGNILAQGRWVTVFSCYEVVQTIVSSVQVGNTPNVQAFVSSLSVASEIQKQLIVNARRCIEHGLDYFEHQSQTSLKAPLATFKAARFFCPHKLGLLKPTAADID